MQQRQRIGLIVAAVVLVVGGFLVARGSSTDSSTRAAGSPSASVVLVRGGKPAGGLKTLSFKGGDEIRFTVSSDVADEIHVHGYDLMKDVKAGGKVSFAFKGDINGVFEVELEGVGVQIASLKVSQ